MGKKDPMGVMGRIRGIVLQKGTQDKSAMPVVSCMK
jgi:hypothetical protein